MAYKRSRISDEDSLNRLLDFQPAEEIPGKIKIALDYQMGPGPILESLETNSHHRVAAGPPIASRRVDSGSSHFYNTFR